MFSCLAFVLFAFLDVDAKIPDDRPSLNRRPNVDLEWVEVYQNTPPEAFIFVDPENSNSAPSSTSSVANACVDCISIDTNHKTAWCASTQQCVAVQDNCDQLIQSTSLCAQLSSNAELNSSINSLTRARDEVRTLKETVDGPITIYLREGIHRLSEPLVLTQKDSGKSSRQVITYASFPGENAIISGGVDLKCTWTSNGFVHTCKSDILNSLSDMPSLFVGDERAHPARFPNFDFHDSTVRGIGFANATGGIGRADDESARSLRQFPAQPTKGLFYNEANFSPRIDQWSNVQDARVFVFPDEHWNMLMYSVDSVNTDDSSIMFGQGGGQANFYMSHGSRGGNVGALSQFFVENVKEELDAEMEYYFDKTTNSLIYFSANDPSTVTFTVPLTSKLISLQGNPKPPNTQNENVYVKHVVFKDLTFKHTLPTYFDLYEIPSGGDWSLVRDGAFWFESASNCGVMNSLFTNIGSNGVFMNGANKFIAVDHCEFNDIGESAIVSAGIKQFCTGSSLVFPRNILISNNDISEIGMYGKQVAGVFVGVSGNVTVSNNFIHEVPRAGININDGFVGGHIIEFNTVVDAVQETSDHGPFNSWGRERYWPEIWNHPQGVDNVPQFFPSGPVTDDTLFPNTVRNNDFTLKFEFPSTIGYGIDMDDGSSNFDVYENIVRGISGGMAIKIGAAGDIHTAENNIFFGTFDLAVQFWVPMTGNSDRFFSNIYANLDQNLDGEIFNVGKITDGGLPLFSDFNLYFAPGVTYNWNFISKDDFISETGLETNSLFGEDPLFADPENDDFSVSDNSPAIELGFHNFKFGADEDFVGLIPRTDAVPEVPPDDNASTSDDSSSSAIGIIVACVIAVLLIMGVSVGVYWRKDQKRGDDMDHVRLEDRQVDGQRGEYRHVLESD